MPHKQSGFKMVGKVSIHTKPKRLKSEKERQPKHVPFSPSPILNSLPPKHSAVTRKIHVSLPSKTTPPTRHLIMVEVLSGRHIASY